MNELDWIDFLKNRVPKNNRVLAGIGDDCALVRVGGEKILLKSDMFIEGVHFKVNTTSYENIGLRSAARVFSDFAACAGLPRFIGVSAGIPVYVKEKNVKKILDGILKICGQYNCALVGGDTARSNRLFLDVWGVGTAPRFIARDTAGVGDVIFVSGPLGARAFNQPFEPRIAEAKYLALNHKVTAMIDISDGFIVDLYRLIRASNKGACLAAENIPLTRGKSDMYRGEDYELIFTVDKNDPYLKKLERKYYRVGVIKSAGFGYMAQCRGKTRPVDIKGYLQF